MDKFIFLRQLMIYIFVHIRALDWIDELLLTDVRIISMDTVKHFPHYIVVTALVISLLGDLWRFT